MARFHKHKTLDSHGIAHFVLPLIVVVLVAIGGTAFLVASHADTPTKTGYLVIDSQDGLYKRVVIGQSSTAVKSQAVSKNRTCNGKPIDGPKATYATYTFTLKPKGTTIIKCSASNLFLFFLKSNQKPENVNFENLASYASVSLPTDYCAFVKKKGLTELVKLTDDGKCIPTAKSASGEIDKITPTLTAKVTPNPVIIGQTGRTNEFILQLPDGDKLSRELCVGTIRVLASIEGPYVKTKDEKLGKSEYPLRFNAKDGTCYYKLVNTKQDVKKDYGPGTVKATLKFSGNKYLRSAETTFEYTVK